MTSDQPPVWLLDVDGVLNADQPEWPTPRKQAVRAGGWDYRLRWAPDLVDQLRSWHSAGSVELRWASTWCPYADKLERLWRLPPLVRALPEAALGSPGRAMTAKLDAALAVVEDERRPLVWTDDDAIPSFGPYRDRLDSAPVPVLLIKTDPKPGLTRGDLERVAAFLNTVR